MLFFFSSRRRHTRWPRDWSSDVCSSDLYSFDIDEAGLVASYEAQRDAYIRFFERLGLDYVIVSAVSGAMGGSRSEEIGRASCRERVKNTGGDECDYGREGETRGL